MLLKWNHENKCLQRKGADIMSDDKTAIIDLTGCKYIMEIHERIKVALDFPDCYGMNWTAFDDFLWSECVAEKVIVVGADTLPKEFAKEMDWMKYYLEECKVYRKERNKVFEYEFVDTL